MPIDRVDASRALAKAISLKETGRRCQEAHRQGVRLVQMLVDAGILEDGFGGLEQDTRADRA